MPFQAPLTHPAEKPILPGMAYNYPPEPAGRGVPKRLRTRKADQLSEFRAEVMAEAVELGLSGATDFEDLAVGVGLGVRYNLGFAPIRVDVATPVVKKRGEAAFQVYVSIGQSF